MGKQERKGMRHSYHGESNQISIEEKQAIKRKGHEDTKTRTNQLITVKIYKTKISLK